MAALSPKINAAAMARKTEGAGYRLLSPAVKREDLAPSRGKERTVKGLEKGLGKKADQNLVSCVSFRTWQSRYQQILKLFLDFCYIT